MPATIDLTAFMDSSLAAGVSMQVVSVSYKESPMLENELGRAGTTVLCQGEGFIQTADQATLQAAIAALTNKTRVSGADFTILGIGGVVVHQVLAAQCLEGGPHIGFEIPEDGGGPTLRRVKFDVQAKIIAIGILHSYKLKIATGPDGLITVTQTGAIVGVGSNLYFSGTVLGPFQTTYPSPRFVVNYDATFPAEAVNSIDNLTTRYTMNAVQMAGLLPQDGGAKVVVGEVTQREDRDEQQRKTTVFEYDLTLSSGDWNALLTSLRPDPAANKIIRESANYSSIRQSRLRASFTILSSADGTTLLNYSRTVVITNPADNYEEFSYPGADPIAVLKPKTLPRLSDSGSATGLGVFPNKPAPLLEDFAQPPVYRLVDVSNYEKQISWDVEQLATDGTAIEIATIAGQISRSSMGGG